VRSLARLTILALAAALAVSQSATSAITVAPNASAPALRVDANGNAEVSWTAAGRRATLLVPATGRPLPGRTLAADDVSQAVRGTHIPFQRVLRHGQGGWYYALQAWRVSVRGPVELRFSRWQGVPTEVSLLAKKSPRGVKLTGRVTFDERPIPPSARGYVFLDAFRGGVLYRLGRAQVAAGASFSGLFPASPLVTTYRATVLGPNIGATYAPDASAIVEPPVDLDPPR